MAFQKATKKAAKLRMSIAGPSGSGKTYTALLFAGAFAPTGKIAVVDTEHGSASKYADQFDFDVMELTNFHPNNYVAAIKDAVKAGYEVVVLDSITHAWNGPGGILSIVNQNFGKWKDVQPIEQAFIEAIIGSPIHIIATMRAKTQYEVEKDERTGKPAPKKVGMGAIQREGMEYEFDIAAMMDVQNTITIEKTRCSALQGVVANRPDASFVEPVLKWLSGVVTEQPAHRQPAQPEVEFMPPAQPEPTSQPPKLGTITDAQSGTLHALGTVLYNGEWDTKRHEIVKAATKKRTQSSNDLTQAEAQTLIAGLEKKIRQAYEALTDELTAGVAVIDPGVLVEIDQLSGVELANAYRGLRQLQPVAA